MYKQQVLVFLNVLHQTSARSSNSSSTGEDGATAALLLATSEGCTFYAGWKVEKLTSLDVVPCLPPPLFFHLFNYNIKWVLIDHTSADFDDCSIFLFYILFLMYLPSPTVLSFYFQALFFTKMAERTAVALKEASAGIESSTEEMDSHDDLLRQAERSASRPACGVEEDDRIHEGLPVVHILDSDGGEHEPLPVDFEIGTGKKVKLIITR